MKSIYFLFLVLGLGGYFGMTTYRQRPMIKPPGILVKDTPTQVNLSLTERPIVFGKDILQPLARYEITARVLAKDRYYWDKMSKYSPWDFALGWQQMSDSKNLEKLDISQSSRFYYIRWGQDSFLSSSEIFKQSANTHLIPLNFVVNDILSNVRVGNVIKLVGYLVRIDARDGSEFLTSLTRDDLGEGACEILYVKSAKVIM